MPLKREVDSEEQNKIEEWYLRYIGEEPKSTGPVEVIATVGLVVLAASLIIGSGLLLFS